MIKIYTNDAGILKFPDINECTEDLDNCHQDADCFNTVGSFYCDCKDGFNGNGTSCYGMYT